MKTKILWLLFNLGAYLVIVGVALLIFFKLLIPIARPSWETTTYVRLPNEDCVCDGPEPTVVLEGNVELL